MIIIIMIHFLQLSFEVTWEVQFSVPSSLPLKFTAMLEIYIVNFWNFLDGG
jgi:hypothetical protein